MNRSLAVLLLVSCVKAAPVAAVTETPPAKWESLPPSYRESYGPKGVIERVECLDSTSISDADAWRACGERRGLDLDPRPLDPLCIPQYPAACVLVRSAREAGRFGVDTGGVGFDEHLLALVGQGPVVARFDSALENGLFRAPEPGACPGGTQRENDYEPMGWLVRVPNGDDVAWHPYSACDPSVP